jgi:hypothetical protein
MKSHREEKQEEAATWILDGFKNYSTRFADDSETEVSCTEIEQYGDEFSRIVRDGEEGDDEFDDKLGQELYDLKTKGCPAVAIVELIVLCTSGFRFTRTLADDLRQAGITDEVLRDVKQSLPHVAQVINVLSGPSFPGLSILLEETSPKKVDQRRLSRSIEALPDTLRMLADMLEKFTDPTVETIADNTDPFLLYLLLRHYGGGLPTLSRLLTTMRLVRHTLNPDAEYLHNFDPLVLKSGERKDPFSKASLQQRLNRFYKEFPVAVLQANNRLSLYVSDAYAKLRESGKTVLESIVEGLKEERANSPVGCANSLSKDLKLTHEQEAEVLTIFDEEQKQVANAFIAMSPSPRRTATAIFPGVFSHKDVLLKLRQIDLSTDDKIRRVLNPAQKEKFDRMQEKPERTCSGWRGKRHGTCDRNDPPHPGPDH